MVFICPEGSYWTAWVGNRTCEPCPGHPHAGTYINDAVTVQACRSLDPLSRNGVDAALLAVLWSISILLALGVLADKFRHRHRIVIHARLVRWLHVVFLLAKFTTDIVLCLWMRWAPLALSLETWERLPISGSDRFAAFVLVLTLFVGIPMLYPLARECACRRTRPRQLYSLVYPSSSRYCPDGNIGLYPVAIGYLCLSFMNQCIWYMKFHHADMDASAVALINKDGDVQSYTQLSAKYHHTAVWISVLWITGLVCLECIFVQYPAERAQAHAEESRASILSAVLAAGRPILPHRSSRLPRASAPLPPPPRVPAPVPAPAPAPAPPRPHPSPVSVELAALFESDQCVVCLEQLPEILFPACGHIVICHTCFQQLPQPTCPQCATPVAHHVLLKRI